MSVAKQEKLKNEILKIYDTGKSKIIKNIIYLYMTYKEFKEKIVGRRLGE